MRYFVSGQIEDPKEQEKYLLGEIEKTPQTFLKAETFGARAVDFTARDVAKKFKEELLKIKPEKEQYKNFSVESFAQKLLLNIMEPAFDKYLTMYKTMISLPGTPTDFTGDRLGATGYETYAKNVFQANRQLLNWDRLNTSKEFGEFYNSVNKLAKMRKTPELSALNDGTPVMLPYGEIRNGEYVDKKGFEVDVHGNRGRGHDVFSMLRYNDSGSVVITAFASRGIAEDKSLTGINNFVNNKMNRQEVLMDEILLTPASPFENDSKTGLPGGLPHGMVFEKHSDNKPAGEFRVVNTLLVYDDNGNLQEEKNWENLSSEDFNKIENGDSSVRVRSSLKYFDEKGKPSRIKITPDDYNVGVFYAKLPQKNV